MLLAIDTSSKNCSVTVSSDGATIGSIYFSSLTTSSTMLPGIVSKCLNVCNASFSNIEKIAVVDGPGSFTGLRIGFSYVQGLAASKGFDCQLYSVSKLLLPSVFIRKILPEIPSFYHILKIKKNHHIGAKIDTVNIKNSYFFNFEDILKNSGLDSSIPIITDSFFENIPNSIIPYYDLVRDISSTLADFINENRPSPVENGLFYPNYHKKSEAELSALLKI